MKRLVYFLVLGVLLWANGCKKDACHGMVCENGGTCENGVCVCASGYSGTHCETFDSCYNVHCSPGIHSHCVGGQCICDSGWVLTDCETMHCTGHSHWVVSTSQCVCDSAWTGANCQIPICSGHSQLVGNTCVCDLNWGGANCDQQIAPIDSFVGNYHLVGHYHVLPDTDILIDTIVPISYVDPVTLSLFNKNCTFETVRLGADTVHNYNYLWYPNADFCKFYFPKTHIDSIFYQGRTGGVVPSTETYLHGIKVH